MIDSKTEVDRLEADMIKKFGGWDAGLEGIRYTGNLQFLQPLIERHADWSIKRMGGHRWEVRQGVKDKSFYGKTLAIALCKALLEIP